MRHRKVSRRLGTGTSHHWAILRNQVTDLFRYGRIETTLAKAKELRRIADKMITLAKRGDLNARREALGFIRDKKVVRKLFTELREKYMDRPGGYTRIVRIGERRGDASLMVVVELVEEKLKTKKSKRKSERLKKINEFIKRKKVELGLLKEEPKEEVSKEGAKEGGEIKAEEETLEAKTEKVEAKDEVSLKEEGAKKEVSEKEVAESASQEAGEESKTEEVKEEKKE